MLRSIPGSGPVVLAKICAFVEWERRFLPEDVQEKYEGSLGDDFGAD